MAFDEQASSEGDSEQRQNPLPFLASEVQLRNIFVIEVAAKRFGSEVPNAATVQLNLEDVSINEADFQAQAVLALNMNFAEEPRPFEISFKLLGQFEYDSSLKPARVRTFLEQGSFSVMLPFVREFLCSLSTRLQIPPVMLPMIKVAPPPIVDSDMETEASSQGI